MKTSNKRSIFRIMYGLNVAGAGVPGFLIVFFPSFAEQYVLWEEQDYAVMTILGSVWLAIGVSSILGVIYPHRFLAIFVVQFLYKTTWLFSFVAPALWHKETLPPAANIIIGVFILLLVEFSLFIRPADFRQRKYSTIPAADFNPV